MDYKEKYEQALERCKEEFNFNNLAYSHEEIKQKLKRVFPELGESENEKIIVLLKNIIKYLDNEGLILPLLGQDCDHEEYAKILAWLEKQGELVNSLSKGLDNAHERIDGLIQKNNLLIEQLEKQGEQTHGDKVEPKFKVGDWVVQGKKLYQIEKVTRLPNNHFQYWTTDGVWFGDGTEAHLWTIQDAKDGDVLVDEKPFIYKKIDANKRCYAYCGISLSGNFRIDSEGEFGEWTWMQDLKPATKEQRDLLFQKMKEAGYEWDAEKKELKKIEQKTAEWSEEDEKERKRVVGLLEGWLYTFRETCYAEDCKCGISWLKSLKQRMKV